MTTDAVDKAHALGVTQRWQSPLRSHGEPVQVRPAHNSQDATNREVAKKR